MRMDSWQTHQVTQCLGAFHRFGTREIHWYHWRLLNRCACWPSWNAHPAMSSENLIHKKSKSVTHVPSHLLYFPHVLEQFSCPPPPALRLPLCLAQLIFSCSTFHECFPNQLQDGSGQLVASVDEPNSRDCISFIGTDAIAYYLSLHLAKIDSCHVGLGWDSSIAWIPLRIISFSWTWGETKLPLLPSFDVALPVASMKCWRFPFLVLVNERDLAVWCQSTRTWTSFGFAPWNSRLIQNLRRPRHLLGLWKPEIEARKSKKNPKERSVTIGLDIRLLPSARWVMGSRKLSSSQN